MFTGRRLNRPAARLGTQSDWLTQFGYQLQECGTSLIMIKLLCSAMTNLEARFKLRFSESFHQATRPISSPPATHQALVPGILLEFNQLKLVVKAGDKETSKPNYRKDSCWRAMKCRQNKATHILKSQIEERSSATLTSPVSKQMMMYSIYHTYLMSPSLQTITAQEITSCTITQSRHLISRLQQAQKWRNRWIQ